MEAKMALVEVFRCTSLISHMPWALPDPVPEFGIPPSGPYSLDPENFHRIRILPWLCKVV